MCNMHGGASVLNLMNTSPCARVHATCTRYPEEVLISDLYLYGRDVDSEMVPCVSYGNFHYLYAILIFIFTAMCFLQIQNISLQIDQIDDKLHTARPIACISSSRTNGANSSLIG